MAQKFLENQGFVLSVENFLHQYVVQNVGTQELQKILKKLTVYQIKGLVQKLQWNVLRI